MKELSEKQKEVALQHMGGTKPVYVKGRSGKQFDYHKCGACGATLEVISNYCQKCGYRVLWDNPRCLTGIDEEGDT